MSECRCDERLKTKAEEFTHLSEKRGAGREGGWGGETLIDVGFAKIKTTEPLRLVKEEAHVGI
jgi:hypothetical protein